MLSPLSPSSSSAISRSITSAIDTAYVKYTAECHASGDYDRLSKLLSTGTALCGVLGMATLLILFLFLDPITAFFDVEPAYYDSARFVIAYIGVVAMPQRRAGRVPGRPIRDPTSGHRQLHARRVRRCRVHRRFGVASVRIRRSRGRRRVRGDDCWASGCHGVSSTTASSSGTRESFQSAARRAATVVRPWRQDADSRHSNHVRRGV